MIASPSLRIHRRSRATRRTAEAGQPLTALAEDERISRNSVRDFAEAQVRPLVREMDEDAQIPRTLIDQLFNLGVRGEGRGGGGVLVDVQNTLVNNAILRWGTDEPKKRYLPRLAAETVGAYALSEAGSAATPSR